MCRFDFSKSSVWHHANRFAPLPLPSFMAELSAALFAMSDTRLYALSALFASFWCGFVSFLSLCALLRCLRAPIQSVGAFVFFCKQMTLKRLEIQRLAFLCLQSPFPLLCRTSPMFSGGVARMTLDGATALHCCRSV